MPRRESQEKRLEYSKIIQLFWGRIVPQNMRIFPCKVQTIMLSYISYQVAGVVQWQNVSFPSWTRGFDSPHLLQVGASSFCCSSFPNHNRLRWVVIWFWVQPWKLRRLYWFGFRRQRAASPSGDCNARRKWIPPAPRVYLCSVFLSRLSCPRAGDLLS